MGYFQVDKVLKLDELYDQVQAGNVFKVHKIVKQILSQTNSLEIKKICRQEIKNVETSAKEIIPMIMFDYAREGNIEAVLESYKLCKENFKIIKPDSYVQNKVKHCVRLAYLVSIKNDAFEIINYFRKGKRSKANDLYKRFKHNTEIILKKPNLFKVVPSKIMRLTTKIEFEGIKCGFKILFRKLRKSEDPRLKLQIINEMEEYLSRLQKELRDSIIFTKLRKIETKIKANKDLF